MHESWVLKAWAPHHTSTPTRCGMVASWALVIIKILITKVLNYIVHHDRRLHDSVGIGQAHSESRWRLLIKVVNEGVVASLDEVWDTSHDSWSVLQGPIKSWYSVILIEDIGSTQRGPLRQLALTPPRGAWDPSLHLVIEVALLDAAGGELQWFYLFLPYLSWVSLWGNRLIIMLKLLGSHCPLFPMLPIRKVHIVTRIFELIIMELT